MRSDFSYHRPQNAQAAYELKTILGENAVYWAGGTDLMLQWQRGVKHIDHCIDITHTATDNILCDEEGIHIGATVKLSALEKIAESYPALSIIGKTVRMMATPQVRTIATIGGNICNAVPSADLAPALLVLDAKIKTVNEEYKIDEFFTGVRKTILSKEDLVVEILIPNKENIGADYQRITRGSVDISLAGAAVAIWVDDKMNIAGSRIALNAVAPTPVRACAAEEYMLGKAVASFTENDLMHIGKLALESTKPIDDIRGTAAFRNYSSIVLVKRAVQTAAAALAKGGK